MHRYVLVGSNPVFIWGLNLGPFYFSLDYDGLYMNEKDAWQNKLFVKYEVFKLQV